MVDEAVKGYCDWIRQAGDLYTVPMQKSVYI